MPTIPISEAKAKLAALVREVAASGEGYVIRVNGHPVAELRPFVPVPTPGRFKDVIRFSDDAFVPLSDDEADASGL
ncbi:MAG: type II toxin-antitoxin system Phd/YefM family antitoxin [Gemmatimonas sp.]|jgi:prevent-host-death family protein